MSKKIIKSREINTGTIYNIYSNESSKYQKFNNQSSKSTSSKKSRNKRDIISTPPYSEFPATTSTFSGLVLMLLFSILFCGNTFAASSISISLSGSVDLNLMGGNAEGVFGKSTTATANVETNNYTGYTFTITGGNNTGALIGANDQNHTIPSITTPLSESAFNTSANNNKWGFLPSHLYNSSTGTTSLNTDYQPSPTLSSSTMIDITDSANEGEPNAYTLALAARVNDQTANDHYSGTFTLAATGNATPYHIAYTDDVQNMPSMTVGETTGASIAISNQVPFKDGYAFLGWCSVPTTGSTCSGTTYQPGGTYTLDPTTDNSTTLHAIWGKGYDTFEAAFAAAQKTKPTGSSYYAMQDITPEICNSIIIGSPYATTDIAKNTLIDTRNNKTYLVAKYADGHCWMRENLNYVFTAGGTVVAYNFQTGETFNYTTTYATQGNTGTAWAQDASDGTRSFQQNKDNCIGGMDIATSGGTGATCDANKPYERIGVLYNWAAATAQTGAQAAAAGSSGETEVKTSICPQGWRLPANSGDYSFSTLMGSYSLPTTNQSQGYSGQLQNPLNFNRPGYYHWSDGALDHRGTNGHFWSSVGYSSTDAHHLSFYSSAFYPQNGNHKGHGFSVRCVAV